MENWNSKFFNLAKGVAGWSKDPSRQIGAIAVNSRTNNVLSMGYNGFPKLISDTPERYANRDTKYKFVVHAEMNVIYNACLNGVSLNNSILYVYGLPICSECAKGIIQVGITEINCMTDWDNIPENWKESLDLSEELFQEAGIKLHKFDNI